ncbi:MAG: hypothetical protein ACT4QA_14015 [Panacagrimonas sp.]
MTNFLNRSKRWIIVVTAFLTVLATLAALRSAQPGAQTSLRNDPLRHRLDASDVTPERSDVNDNAMGMERVDDMAREKLGPMPKLADPTELRRIEARDRQGALALEQVRRVREIRRREGSAAAVAALKAGRPKTAP